MNHKVLILILLFPTFLYSQDVLNEYYAVSSLVNYTDSLKCDAGEDLSSLNPGDKVVIIQMKGSRFDTSDVAWITEEGHDTTYRATGRFEFMAVKSVDNLTKKIVFTANFKRKYDDKEVVQVVKIYETETLVVNNPVTALSWDGKKGGVVAIVATSKLELNADIDASGKGFRGASPIETTAGCRPKYAQDTFYFKTGSLNKGGLKGEGILTHNFPYNVGPGHAFNGGGGGIGYFGGGGGGSSHASGGRGGAQDTLCISKPTLKGLGGSALKDDFFYRDYDTVLIGYHELWAITMGGGGGSSTQNGSYTATAGGNGGGIIIILTDTLTGNSKSISSNGMDVLNTATAGAGGGGAGGTVVLDAAVVTSDVNISLRGGKGGDTGGDCTTQSGGSGGGGAGGVFIHSGLTSFLNVNVDVSKGNRGLSACENRGVGGSSGTTIVNFEPVLNGFSFNAISGDDTICGNAPQKIYGTIPKGKGPFTFKWLSRSTTGGNWTDLNVNTKDYQPDAFSGTKYFTRVVTNGDSQDDTAFSVKIFAWDPIEQNDLLLTDTFCFGNSPGTLKSKNIVGGNGTFSYSWQTRTESEPWADRTDWKDVANPTEGGLEETTYYRRMVVSAKICFDTSAMDSITIHEPIQNNAFITPDTTICENLNGGEIKARAPMGGLPGDYRYAWVQRKDGGQYSLIIGENKSFLQVSKLSETTYYRRIVVSGSDSACVDTAMPRKIEVLSGIGGNVITTDSVRYCYGDDPEAIEGGVLTGGEEGVYDIIWQQDGASGWNTIPGKVSNDFEPPKLSDSVRYRRIVVSGNYDACIDTSNIISIAVIPEIINNLQSADENICQNSQPLPFNEVSATGGTGTYSYLWLEMPEDGIWQEASTKAGNNKDISYIPGELTGTTYYKRQVRSQICADTSSEIKITVYPKITNNNIEGPSEQYACFNISKTVLGAVPQGGNGAYDYYWQSSSDNINWQDAPDSDTSSFREANYISPKLKDSVYFRRIVHSGETAQCKDTTVPVYIFIRELPRGDIIENDTATLCDGGEIAIGYNISGEHPFILEVGDSSAGIFLKETEIEEEGAGQITFKLDSMGLDKNSPNKAVNLKALRIIDKYKCRANLSGSTGLIKTVVYANPNANAGDDFEICGLETRLNALPSVGEGIWNADNIQFDDVSDPNTSIAVEEELSGSVGYVAKSFSWTETNGEKCIDRDTLNITFYRQPTPDYVDAGEDIEKDYEFEAPLEARADFGNGLWTSSEFNEGEATFYYDTMPDARVEVDGVGDYWLIWTVKNEACKDLSDSLLFTVRELKVYGGFSPNGDGINDNYSIDLSEESEVVFTIMDRNGKQVKKVEDRKRVEWDGTNENGEQMPADTYFFILEEKGRKARTGYIELRR